MSRSGYVDDVDDGTLNVWRGAVASALRGKRGQAFLREMRDALDAMPVKRLIVEELVCADGVCAMGSVVARRGLDASNVDQTEYEDVAKLMGVAEAMVREIAFMNDEGAWYPESPEQRWTRMRAWVEKQIKPEQPHAD